MKNGEKKGFDVFDVPAYLREIKEWRVNLRAIARGALDMQGIEESERYNLQRSPGRHRPNRQTKPRLLDLS